MRTIHSGALALLLFAAALTGPLLPQAVVGAPADTPKPIADMDALLAQLAQRSASKIGTSDDFTIIVTAGEYAIGTLLRHGTSIPIDYHACLPQDPPPRVRTPNLFPSYTISRSVSADLGLDEDVTRGLVSLGAKFKDNAGVELNFKDPGLQVLTDDDFSSIMSHPKCRQAIGLNSVWLVRGYVSAKRTFTLKSDVALSANGSIKKILSFNVTPIVNSNNVELADSEDVGFLQVVSQVSTKPPVAISHALTPPGAESALAPAIATGVVLSKPSAPTTAVPGRVWVQRDVQDLSNVDKQLITELQALALDVEKKVEAVPTARMPTGAQVRYFNVGDEALAARVLAAMKTHFPAARIVRIGLPAPRGQIEVWLPKIKPRGPA